MSVFVIAEAGVNHGGSWTTALDLVDAAKDAGADAVKFQMFNSRKLWGDDRVKKYEFKFDVYKALAAHCAEIGIEFMCTPFGVEELILLTPLLSRVKIASGCLTRKPLLEAARDTGLPVILSTGMSDLEEVKRAASLLPFTHLTLLHCTSAYPCRLEDVNLKAMFRLQEMQYPVGYSDHTSGITVAIAAVALGATVIEKHLTLDRNADGPDHKASITPREFKAMTIAINEVGWALGDGVKRVMDSEMKLRAAWRGH